MVLLGPDLTRVRIREGLAALGVSGKQAKRLEKQYRDYQATRVSREADEPGDSA